jgi:hypothetical protein
MADNRLAAANSGKIPRASELRIAFPPCVKLSRSIAGWPWRKWNGLDSASIRMRDTGGGYWTARFRPQELPVKDGQLVGSWSRQYLAATELLDRFKDLDRNILTTQAFVTTGIQLLECLRAAEWIIDVWMNTIMIRHELKKKYALKAKVQHVAPRAARAARTADAVPDSTGYEGVAEFVWSLTHVPADVIVSEA